MIVLIIGVGTVIRTAYLNVVPAGISDDELDTVLTAQSISYTGKTIDGTFSPFSFQSVPPNTQAPSARGPYMLLAPFAGLLHGLGEVKIPFAVISVLTVIVLTCIAWILWGKRIALFTAFVSSFNPWSIYFGRTAFESPLSVFFTCLFLLCTLTLRNWWLLLSLIPWFIGLYSYQGTIIIYPLVLVLGTFCVWKLRRSAFGKQYLVVATFGILAFSLFMIAFKGDRAGSRMGEIAVPSNPTIIARVDDQRRKSVQMPINSIVLNKYTVAGWQILGQYINAFSTEHLFVSGEARSTFSLWNHGLLYSIEFVLFIIGMYSAYRMNKNKTRFLVALLLIAPIPTAISTVGVSYALRAALMYPIFCIFIAIGIGEVFTIHRFSELIRFCLVGLYAVVIINFLHVYFIQNPVNNSEGFGFSNRVLSRYMMLASNSDKDVLYIGNNVVNTYSQYIFYSDLMTRNSIEGIQQSIRTHTFAVGPIRFLECPTGETDFTSDKTVIVPYGKVCPSLTAFTKQSDPVVIAQLSDSGRIFEIYHDTVCSKYPLSEYQPLISFNDLEVESMPVDKFCTTYISKPRPNLLPPAPGN